MSSKYKQPERRPGDGPVGFFILPTGLVQITVETNGKVESIVMSEFNATRIFGMLGVALEIPMVKGLRIKL